MSESASTSTGIAARYATAMFDLATEAAAIDALAKDVDALEAALAASADLRDLISSPIYRRDESQAAVGAVAKAMKLGMIATNTLQVMAQKRRLFVLPMVLRAVRAQIAESRGEMTAEVVSAKALTQTQADKLAKALSGSVGKKINLNATVDESLIGGLIVKVGSKMIDSSIRSKLNSLQNTMKEVG